MSTTSLAQAVHSLIETATVPGYSLPPVFDSDASDADGVPWIVYTLGIPEVSDRSIAHVEHARTARLSVKCVSGTGAGCRLIGDAVDAVLEGANLAVTGWSLGPVGGVNFRDPYPDFQVTLTNGAHPMVQVQEYRFTAVRIA